MKPTLVYLNVATLAETDVTILKHLTNDFEVHWFVIYEPAKNSSLSINYIQDYANRNHIALHVCTRNFRIRSPKNWLYYRDIYNQISKLNPDLIYHCNTEFYWAFFFLFSKYRVVMGLHDVNPHSSKRGFASKFKSFTNSFVRRVFHNHIVFSANQQRLYKSIYGRDVFNTGMSCKDFGTPTVVTPKIEDGIKLVFFGTIAHYKGVDILIKALEEVIASGITNISLTIAGKGNDQEWKEYYTPLIKSKAYYNIQYRYLESDEIPNLMASHHFLILPYRDATQSGPVLIAANYCKPLIAPNFGCFADTYNEDSGILYPQGELTQALKTVSQITQSSYDKMCQSCKKIKKENSEESVAENFITYFKDTIKSKK